jgi:methionine synthase II (cobalamin-independent)
MNAVQLIQEAIRQVVLACTSKGNELFAAGLHEPAVNGWIPLDPAVATEAHIELNAALQAVRSVAQQLPGDALVNLHQYLNRAENGLEYSLATINADSCDHVKVHASRAQSAQYQLAGLITLSESIVQSLGTV